MLCLTLTGKSEQECLQQIEKSRGSIDLVEIRLDLLGHVSADTVRNIVTGSRLPSILTYRRKRDGGAYDGGERQRLSSLCELVACGVTYIDIEEDVKRPELEQKARELGVKIIRSCHDLEKVPSDLYARIVKLKKRGDVAKIAVTVTCVEDLMKLFGARRELQSLKEKVIVGMGEFGIPSRILYKRTGSLFTFTSVDGKGASGHLSPRIMDGLYHARSVNEDTKIFGIIGNPVMHTSSPRIHNPGFHLVGLNAIYVPFLVDEVRSFFQLADLLSIKGFSVTVPHKQAVLPYLGKISREVKLIGSCNTVLRHAMMWKGVNTDFYGFLDPIRPLLDASRIRSAVVVGAGGAARSVVWALRNHYCRVTILNRTIERARDLAAQTGSSYGPLDDHAALESADLIVQTTSAGMPPLEEIDPLEGYSFSKEQIVYDLVYKPRYTRLLSRAAEAGCQIIFGSQMLIAQGVLQFESFTGFNYPEGLDAELL